MDTERNHLSFLSKQELKAVHDLQVCTEEIYYQCENGSTDELHKAIMNATLALGKVTTTLTDIALAFDDLKE